MEAYKKIRSKQISQESTAWANANPGVKGEWQRRKAGFVAGAKWYDSIYPNKLTPERLAKAKSEYLSKMRVLDYAAKGAGFIAGAEWASNTPPA